MRDLSRFFAFTAWLALTACVAPPDDALPVYRSEPLALVSADERVQGVLVVDGGRFVQGDNAITVQLEADTDALVSASAFMPAHGHGTDPPDLRREGDTFRVERLSLFMPGRWEITLDLSWPGGVDEYVFAVDVR